MNDNFSPAVRPFPSTSTRTTPIGEISPESLEELGLESFQTEFDGLLAQHGPKRLLFE
jgi:hypothetical protein